MKAFMARFVVHLPMLMRRNSAFTLIEIMIVVSIIALLAAIAVPAFMRARQRTQNAKFINALRIATAAIEQYAIEHNGYPVDANKGIIPPGLATYLDPTLDWTAATPIGGEWDWEFKRFGVTAAVSVVGPTVSIEQLEDIDSTYDDGDLTTGRFHRISTGRYAEIIEK